MLLDTFYKHENWLNNHTAKLWLFSELEILVPFTGSIGGNQCPRWVYKVTSSNKTNLRWGFYPRKDGYRITKVDLQTPFTASEKVKGEVIKNWPCWIHTRKEGWLVYSAYIIALFALVEKSDFSFHKKELKEIVGVNSKAIPRIIKLLEHIGIDYDEYKDGREVYSLVTK